MYRALGSLLLVIFSHALIAQNAPLIAQFDPATGVLPTPNNLLFSGSQDGTLNIPIADPSDPASATLQALNALDGFSTVAPAVATFSAAVDPSTLIAGETVRVFEVDIENPFLNPSTGTPFAVTGVIDELIGEQDFTVQLQAADPEQRTIEILPLLPLKPKTAYMVVLTDGIRGVNSAAATLPDLTYIFARYRPHALIDRQGRSQFTRLTDAQAQALEPIRKIVVSQEQAAAAVGLRKGNIVLSWSFMTQSIDDALQAIRATLTPQTFNLSPLGIDTSATLGLGLANILAGALQVPYYLEAPTLVPTVILSSQWRAANDLEVTRYTPQAVATQTLSIPVLATFPSPASGHTQPTAGWPVVIFQHGITQNRSNLLAIADALAAAGYAAVAIDLPLHGITDTSNPFYNAAMERTFNLDLVNNETRAPGPDGSIDPSGIHFLNLTSLLTSRDNLRQGAADLLHLNASLGQADSDGDGQADFDLGRVGFVGHSLGGMVGSLLLGVDEAGIGPASLGMPGGGIPKLLENSASFGPFIQAGLAAVGLQADTPEYEALFRAAQQVLDSGDAINYAQAAADHHPIHLVEIIGPPPDQTIPNRVDGAPLSGTEPLIQAMGLASAGTSQRDENGLRVAVRFLAGGHSSLLNPEPAPEVTIEIQQQIAAFIASEGVFLPIENSAIVQQP